MELLLLSNSTLPGKAWLEHALPVISGTAERPPFGGVYPFRRRHADLG
ncbi:Peptidase E [Raoultella terrigena]|uniref:Peptidase E n=1 Tax=Raoultella terrigena TaxID=577 RepID=A0A4V6J293_RAOTE|nr:Peptidase E [Raoultella terrigena]